MRAWARRPLAASGHEADHKQIVMLFYSAYFMVIMIFYDAVRARLEGALGVGEAWAMISYTYTHT